MASTNQETEHTTTEQRIMRTKLPEWYGQGSPRICLLQIQKVETANEEVEAKRKALEDTLYWDHEDYIESEQGARPEGIDPKADVRVCGIGGCTLRIFQAEDGSDIQTGECKAASYCLRDRFKAVGKAATVEEGQALYADIIDTCDGASSSTQAGHFCPRLDCDLSAGVSVDQVPGTDGNCAVKNLVQIEGFEP
jgi:hypothetical protein